MSDTSAAATDNDPTTVLLPTTGLRDRGINYDTGVLTGDHRTRKQFDPSTVSAEMKLIADDLHCTAVRVSGDDLNRLTIAGNAALDAGLSLWFAPFPTNLSPSRLVDYLADAAHHAEQLRRRRDDVTLVLGCEVSLFGHGCCPVTMSSADSPQ